MSADERYGFMVNIYVRLLSDYNRLSQSSESWFCVPCLFYILPQFMNSVLLNAISNKLLHCYFVLFYLYDIALSWHCFLQQEKGFINTHVELDYKNKAGKLYLGNL